MIGMIALRRFIFGKFSSPPEYPRWPPRGEVESWMRGKIAHYRVHHPDDAFRLFDLSCGDYLPTAVHVAGDFGPAELAVYRKLKAENPDLVDQARRSTGHLYSRSTINDPEDWPDVDMLP
jgi:hypothetical protein